MTRAPIRKYLISSALALGSSSALIMAAVVPGTPASAQLTVFDPTNYAQNLLTAARSLTQITHQITSLQNEATMLINMAKNLTRIDFPELQKLQQKLQQIDGLMGQAQGLDFKVDGLEDKFRALFPNSFDAALRTDQRVANAKMRLDTAMTGFRQTMKMQSQVVENVQDDAKALADLVARSQGTEGSLQAQQATNQLLALAAKQQFQLQQMMAAQFRSEATEQTRRLQETQEARAATKKFLGSGKAYTPQ
jgi:P-type conjugative transfer protein TrbJ